MDLFGTGDFPLLTVNISVVNSLNWFTFSSRLWTAVLPTLHNEDTQLSMCAWAADQASAQNPRIPMDDLFAQYCMLIITAFTPFFFFFLLPVGMGKAFVCVLGGGFKNNYPKLFNVLPFFFFFWLLLYHFKFWPQASIWARGLLEASSFLYLVMNVNRCFYYTKLNVISRS